MQKPRLQVPDTDRREELEVKLARVRRWLEQTGARAVLVTDQGAFAWLTCGGDSHASLGQAEGTASVLVTLEHAFLLAANNELRRILDEEVAPLPFEPVTWPWYQPAAARAHVERLGAPGPVVSDLGQLGLSRAAASFATLRYTLLPPEIERYRQLGQDAAAALERRAPRLAPGSASATWPPSSRAAAWLTGSCRSSCWWRAARRKRKRS
ncbi:hypothetical protein AKJ09_07332 [Labilithrix luteola]|uniref:Creatinase N-terminal domain-containing protein n=1 Tax=Labilithrix luteola TaxID=1391654 RepID=A0A0K1Q4J8_9BACT|nr:hypothetical protein [Labilithrix luteola]AKV00669.1 hypothetical protein AKJ09_07332 [Labilithrix luteola]